MTDSECPNPVYYILTVSRCIYSTFTSNFNVIGMAKVTGCENGARDRAWSVNGLADPENPRLVFYLMFLFRSVHISNHFSGHSGSKFKELG